MSRTLTPLEFYDEPRIHQDYQAARSAPDEPNGALEEPYVLEFLGGVTGHAVLDLGCGAAGIAPRLLAAGARSYTGVDGSARMVERARSGLPGGAEVAQADLETWAPPPDAAYDTVLSRMALHYVVDLAGLLVRVRAGCAPGAQLVLSVEHPVVTSSYDADWDPDHVPRVWHVHGYYDEGPRSCPWLDARVRKQHRTLETYLRLLRAAGFTLDRLSEGTPRSERFRDPDTYARRRAVPMYLTLRAVADAGPRRGQPCG